MEEVRWLSPAVLLGIFLFLFVFGSCVYSFLNVVIYRVPRKMSFVRGRSFCPSCGHVLTGKDLIPVVSRIALGGCCRYCNARIDRRDTVIEILGGLFACICFLIYGFQARTVLSFLFLSVCTVISFVDWDTMEIPDGFTAAVIVIAAASVPFWPEITLRERLIGAAAVSIPMLLIALKIPGAFGGGDIKLTAAAGLLLGWKNSLLAAFLAILAGGFYGIYLLCLKKKGKKDRFAFGPFLCGGMAAALFWGEGVFRWYLGLTEFLM